MTKKRTKIRSAQVFDNLAKLSRPANHNAEAEDESPDLTTLDHQPIRMVLDSARIPRLKRFRSQLLHQWLVETFEPCRSADIGGGKGLLSYLLNLDGWWATVIDPLDQPLPDKYKDIRSERRVKIPPEATVPRLKAGFEVVMAADFDLLIGMHAHGCNAKIIDAAARYGCGFVLFPCCVIDEPFHPLLGVHWLEELASYAVNKDQAVFPFRLNFKGQNIGLCHAGKCRLKSG
jgi:hypothetical protein